MARIAFVLDRIFRKFGLSGKSFIPMLIGTGCGIPGIMASRTIENERDRRMTIMTTTFIPCGAKVPFIGNDRRRSVRRQRLGFHLRLLHRHGCHHHFRYHAEEDQDVLPAIPLPSLWSCPRITGPLSAMSCVPCGSAAGPSSRRPVPSSCFPPSLCGSPPTSAGWTGSSGMLGGGSDQRFYPGQDRQCHRLDLCTPRLGQLAGDRCFHHRSGCEGKHRWYAWASSTAAAPALYTMPSRLRSTASPVTPSWYSTCCALPASRPSVQSSVR